jgi:hypothetical protein
MATSRNILDRKETHFVLWRPGSIMNAPQLIVAQLRSGNPAELANEKQFTMTPAVGVTGLWEIAARDCQLISGQIVKPTGQANLRRTCNHPIGLYP